MPRIYAPGTVLMRPMLDPMARNWGMFAFRGVLAILFGVLTFAWPGVTLLTLVALYGAYALVDGLFALGSAVTKGPPAPRWWLILYGIAGIAAGAVTFFYPGMTGMVLLYFIAAWAIVGGIFQIIGAIQMRKEIEGEWLLVLSGVISVLFGAYIIAFPGAGALSVALIIGMFAIFIGILQLAFALRLRKHAEVRI